MGTDANTPWRWMTAAIILLYIILSVGMGYVVNEAYVTRQALCTLHDNLVETNRTSRAFLKEHPNGIPGISAQAIQQGIDNRQHSIDALVPLECGS